MVRLSLFVVCSIMCTALLGCALTRETHVAEQQVEQPEPLIDTFLYVLEVDDSLVPVAFADTTTIPALAQAGDLIAQAQAHTEAEKFASAESLLASAVEILGTVEDTSLGATDSLELFLGRITTLYSDILPSEYLDSLPEEVSVMVMERVLTRSLDSLRVSTEDSSALSKLLCQKGVDYDFPMVWNDRVYTALTFFAHSKRSPIKRWLERSATYLPLMKEIVTAHGLPSDIAYLPLIESGFSPVAYSHAHASGLWQFIPSTGRRYGLRQSYWLDERRDPVKSAKSAMAYLSVLYEEFEDWHLALAAYNCGEGRVRRAIRAADTTDYWSLKLPKETMYYVPKFIAALIVAKNPSCFGIDLPQTPPANHDRVYFSDCIDLSKIAEGIDASAQELKKSNPHILHWCTPPDHDSVMLYLPEGTRDSFLQFYASIPEEEKVRWYRYRIARGDNLIGIARKFKTSVRAIQSVNRLHGSRIVAGKHLFIPIPVTARVASAPASQPVTSRSSATARYVADRPDNTRDVKYRVQRGETLSGLSQLFNIPIREIAGWNNLRPNAHLREGQVLVLYLPKDTPDTAPKKKLASKANVGKYTVVKGDNLYTIAKNLGVNWKDLADWNGLQRQRPVIFPGNTLLYLSSNQSKPSNDSGSRNTAQGLATRTIRYEVRRGDNLSSLASLFDVPLKVLMEMNDLSESSVIRPGDILDIPSGQNARGKTSNENGSRVVYYKVKAGDTLWDIARRYRVTVNQICQANGLGSRAVLRPGDTLRVVTSEDI